LVDLDIDGADFSRMVYRIIFYNEKGIDFSKSDSVVSFLFRMLLVLLYFIRNFKRN
jgi:hypothetical protein